MLVSDTRVVYRYGMSENGSLDPKTLVAELEAKRAEIRAKREAEEAEEAEITADIAAVERLRARGLFPSEAAPTDSRKLLTPESVYYGLGIAEAGMKEMEIHGSPQKTKEILSVLTEAGFEILSKDRVGALGAALSRREKKMRDVVLMGDATWGLTKWFPEEEVAKYRSARTVASIRDHAEHVQRTKDGMRLAKETRGVRFGATLKFTPEKREQARTMVESGMKVPEVAKVLKLSRALLYSHGYGRIKPKVNGDGDKPENIEGLFRH